MDFRRARDAHNGRPETAQRPSSSVKRSIARRSRLVGRPAPWSRAAGTGSGGCTSMDKSSNSVRALSAPPRRSAKPTILSTRTPRSSAMVTTSPALTARLAASTRWPLRRTCPDPASAAAAARVRTTRACHSHLSMRWRSNCEGGSSPLLGVRLELGLQGRKLGERRIRVRLAVATVAAVATLDVLCAQLGIAVRPIAAVGAIAARLAALIAVLALRAFATPFAARRPIGAIRPIRPVAAARPIGALVAAMSMLVGRALGRSRPRGDGYLDGHAFAARGDGCPRLLCRTRRAAALRGQPRRTALAVGTAARSPDFDQFGLRGFGLFRLEPFGFACVGGNVERRRVRQGGGRSRISRDRQLDRRT